MDADSEPTQLVVHALGARVVVDLDQSWLTRGQRAWLHEIWSRARPDPGPGDAPTVVLRPPAVAKARTLRRLADALSSEVTLAALDCQAGHLLLLHAAGLAHPDTGSTLALVAPSGHGKTTAARVLGEQWGYVSDETVAVDPTSLRVFGHPKPLSVCGEGRVKDQLGPDQLELRRAPKGTALARIVLLARDPEHVGPPRLTPVDLGRALGELTPETSFLTRWERPLATLARVISTTGGVLRVEYAEARQLLDLRDDLLTFDRRPGEWSPMPDSRVQEAISTDDTLALLVNDDPARVVVLDGIGPTVWRLTRDPGWEASDLAQAVVAEHGRPPHGSADASVADCLESLRAHGLLESAGMT